MKIEECKTVEEVEALRCHECSSTHHWGWCDAPWIKCGYKSRIKEILGQSDCKYNSLDSQLLDLGIDT